MTDDAKLANLLEWLDVLAEQDPASIEADWASAIRQLMEELKQARIAGAWLYGLELERPADYAEQKPLAMHACRLAFTHPPTPS